MIKYDVFKSPSSKQSVETTYHARVVNEGVLSYEELKKKLSSYSSATPGDVSLVLDGIVSVMQECFKRGQILELGNLGSFSVRLSSGNKKLEHAVHPRNMKVTGIAFRPKKQLINSLNDKVDFRRSTTTVHSVEYSDTELSSILTTYFKDHEFITRSTFQNLCGMTRSTAIRRINALLKGKYPMLEKCDSKCVGLYKPTPGSFQPIE